MLMRRLIGIPLRVVWSTDETTIAPHFNIPIISTSLLTESNRQFPYALHALPSYLRSEWDSPTFKPYRDAFPADVRDTPEQLIAYVREVSEKDMKVSCLKQLQGLIWEQGYHDGAYKAPIYPDVLPAIKDWVDKLGLVVAIYSSGSVAAQKLLFRYTDADVSDMTIYFSDYFDTVNAGPKLEAASYKTITEKTGINASSWLFLSDNVKEVEAAKLAGMDAAVVVRPGNAPLTPEERDAHLVVENGFDEVTTWLSATSPWHQTRKGATA